MSQVPSPDYYAELDNQPYEFDILGVWVREDGYYLGTDSGCSCPMYWENYTEDELTGPLTFEQMAEEARSLAEISRNVVYACDEVEEMLKEVQDDLSQ